jgi:arylsulfatase A-like enzyme
MDQQNRRPIFFQRGLRVGAALPLALALWLGAVAPEARAQASSAQPNVIFILADDMGWGDISRFGGTDFTTPNIDSLASQGMTLARAYAWPVCSPSRAALLTGMDPKRVGVPAVLLPGGAGINTNSYTMAEHLRRQGYATAVIGKWHLGYEGNALPNARGFDTFFGFRGGQINYTNYFYSTEGTNDLWSNETDVASDYIGQYCTRVFTQKALEFIDANTNKPFFLYLAYNAPHYPLSRYETNIVAQYSYLTNQNRRFFAAMTRAMDDGIGEVLTKLQQRGLTSNTLLWFMTDNGPMTNQGGDPQPFRGEKFQLLDGGIRVPALVKWPGKIPANSTNAAPFMIWDVFPTVAAATGLPTPPSLRMDGTNQLPVLLGGAPQNAPALPMFNDGNVNRRALITDDWKYINTNGTSELYAMPYDQREETNLASAYPALVETYELLLTNQWLNLLKGIYATNDPAVILRLRKQ